MAGPARCRHDLQHGGRLSWVICRKISLDQLRRREDTRERTDNDLAALSDSIRDVGLLNPLSVRAVGEGHYEVFAGSHRLQAVDLLGWEEVPCIVMDLDDMLAEMAMIAENVHRTELTQLQRDDQVARWIELAGQRSRPDEVFSQDEPLGGRPEGGINSAARELGINKNDAYRAVQVAALSPEAKAAAREMGMDDNRTALLSAAKQPTPAAQVQSIQRHAERAHGGIANRYQFSGTAAPGTPEPVDYDALEKRFTAGGEWFLKADLTGLLSSLGGKGPRRAQALRLMSSLAEHLDAVREGASR